MIAPLLRFMVVLPLSQVQTLVRQIAAEVAGDRTLARWSDVIIRGRGTSDDARRNENAD